MSKLYIDGTKYRQFGHDVLLTSMSFKSYMSMFKVDPLVQRNLDRKKQLDIRTFILNTLERNEPLYFSPFVFSARGNIVEDDTGVWIKLDDYLYISDGQHRTYALDAAVTTLKNLLDVEMREEEVAKLTAQLNYLYDFQVAMQIYLSLNTEEERQLFSDLNSNRREPKPDQLLQFDHRDFYSVLTRQVTEALKEEMEIAMSVSRLQYTSSALTTATTMKRCLIALFEGVITPKEVADYTETQIHASYEIALMFFKKWKEIFPKNAHDRKKYTCGLSGIQIALAFVVNLLVHNKKVTYEEAIEMLTHLQSCSWLHEEPLFISVYKSEQQKIVGHSSSEAIYKIAQSFCQQIEKSLVVKQ